MVLTWALIYSDYCVFVAQVNTACEITTTYNKSILKICSSEGLQLYLCVWYLIKDPDLPVDCGSWHPMAVVVEEDSLLFGIASQRRAQLLHLIHCGVQTLLVTCLKNRRRERKMFYI